jgi:hypothetical protein
MSAPVDHEFCARPATVQRSSIRIKTGCFMRKSGWNGVQFPCEIMKKPANQRQNPANPLREGFL